MTVADRPAAPDSDVPEPQDEVLAMFADQGTALHRFCRSLLRAPDDAEDVVQETFLKRLWHLQAAGDRRNLRPRPVAS
jgi:DNA-directed RNA polymerase specialized sigma24 family protein